MAQSYNRANPRTQHHKMCHALTILVEMASSTNLAAVVLPRSPSTGMLVE